MCRLMSNADLPQHLRAYGPGPSRWGWILRLPAGPGRLSAWSRAYDLHHPSPFDPDLPFRIHRWGCEGLEMARASIDRYMRHLFGRQIRLAAWAFRPMRNVARILARVPQG